MIRYNEFLVLLRGQKFKNLKKKDIIFELIWRVWVWSKNLWGFWIRVEKIVFKIQNFQMNLNQIFKLSQFLTGLWATIFNKFHSHRASTTGLCSEHGPTIFCKLHLLPFNAYQRVQGNARGNVCPFLHAFLFFGSFSILFFIFYFYIIKYYFIG